MVLEPKRKCYTSFRLVSLAQIHRIGSRSIEMQSGELHREPLAAVRPDPSVVVPCYVKFVSLIGRFNSLFDGVGNLPLDR